MSKEQTDYLVRTGGLIGAIAFGYLLISKNDSTILWWTVAAFNYGLAIYSLSRQQDRNRWTNVFLFAG